MYSNRKLNQLLLQLGNHPSYIRFKHLRLKTIKDHAYLLDTQFLSSIISLFHMTINIWFMSRFFSIANSQFSIMIDSYLFTEETFCVHLIFIIVLLIV